MKRLEKVVRVGDKDMKNFLVAWHDNKPLHILSSLTSVKSECNRVVRNQDGSWDPNRKVDRPSVIKSIMLEWAVRMVLISVFLTTDLKSKQLIHGTRRSLSILLLLVLQMVLLYIKSFTGYHQLTPF